MDKLNRLRRMTAKEISYRLCKKVQSELERARFLLGLNEGLGRDLFSGIRCVKGNACGNRAGNLLEESIAFKRYIEEGPAHRFYIPAADQERASLRRFVSDRFPHWVERCVAEADRLCEHRIEILGLGELELGCPIDWHRDPLTGLSWRRRFWADYDPVRDCSAGDAKTILELNRHQHLPRLAKAFFFTGDKRYAREAISQLESWIEQNPPGLGINWQSSLDIAIRAISWLWTLFFLLPSDALDERSARRVCKSLFAQLDHVYRYPSTYTAPNTHLIGEAAALFMAGLLFAEFKRAQSWRNAGASILVSEMDRQVLSDGVHGELSTYYHCYALDFYLLAMTLARQNRFPFPDHAWTKLSRMMEYIMHLTRSDGSMPLLGDDDGGRVLALHHKNYRSFRDALCAGAVMLRREDLKYQAGEFTEETFWLLGPDAWPIYNSLASAPPAEVRNFYPVAGYLIERSDWGTDGSHLVFDCGGLGMFNGGHGHSDALSLVLFSRGKELLADPGTFVYNGAAVWRNYFRSTRAHNTVIVDGEDQASAGGTFKWEGPSRTRVVQEFVLPGLDYIAGENHDYERLPEGILHARRLLYIRPDYWAVMDDFRGEGEHLFDLHYHFPPDAEVQLQASVQTESKLHVAAHAGQAGLFLFLIASHHLRAQILRGQTNPIQGWVSDLYGVKNPAPVLRAVLQAPAPAGTISLLIPFQASPGTGSPTDRASCQARPVEVEGVGALACMLENRNFEDYLVLSTQNSKARLMDFEMDGELFWMRMKNGRLAQLLAIQARGFCDTRGILFEQSETLPYVWARFGEENVVIESRDAKGADYVRHLRDREFQYR